MSNRIVMAVIVVLSLGIVGILGYACGIQNGATIMPTEMPADVEGEEDTATPETLPKPPQVFEKFFKGIPYLGSLDPEFTKSEEERSFLRFQVEAGNRVEGEVVLIKYDFSEPGVPVSVGVEPVFAKIRDPYDNIISETSYSMTREGRYSAHQKYPWQFAFIAASGGEYSLQVAMFVFPHSSGYEAQLRVVVYDE